MRYDYDISKFHTRSWCPVALKSLKDAGLEKLHQLLGITGRNDKPWDAWDGVVPSGKWGYSWENYRKTIGKP